MNLKFSRVINVKYVGVSVLIFPGNMILLLSNIIVKYRLASKNDRLYRKPISLNHIYLKP